MPVSPSLRVIQPALWARSLVMPMRHPRHRRLAAMSAPPSSPACRSDGHHVRGYGRSAARVSADGRRDGRGRRGHSARGLDRGARRRRRRLLPHPLDGGPARTAFADRERRAARAVRRRRGRAPACGGSSTSAGSCPPTAALSRHLASRLAVEELLLAAAPESIAMRASIVIGARSRSFRFLVRLIERMPVLALPAWRDNRTAPVDGRDMLEFLARAATAPAALSGRSWDIAGPDVMSYGELVERIARRHAGQPPRAWASNVTHDGAGLGRGGRDRRRGRRPHRAADGIARTRPAPPPRRPLRPSASACTRFDAAVERALREWESDRGAGRPR